MSIHSYVGDASTWSGLLSGDEKVAAAANKLIYVEEWGVATSYNSDFDDQAAAINGAGYPWVSLGPWLIDFDVNRSIRSIGSSFLGTMALKRATVGVVRDTTASRLV
jgi:hypothetical protein